MDLPALPQEFHAAVARKDWEAAALYALVTAADWIEEVGSEAAEALIDELETAKRRPHRGSRARRRG